MTSDDEWQVELSNGRAVYLKPAEHGAPQARASLMSLMMTLIACLIRAEHGAPQTRDALRSHLAICNSPHHLASSHLASSHHTSPQLALTTVSPPTFSCSTHVPIHRRASHSHRAAVGRSERPLNQRRSPSRREIRSSRLTSSPQSGASPTSSSTEMASTRRTCAS